jgi:hypothetical protein
MAILRRSELSMIKSTEYDVNNISLTSEDNYISILPEEGSIHYEISIASPTSENGWYRKGKKVIRVILGRLGEIYRMSAPKIGIATEGSNIAEAWKTFFDEINKRKDYANLTFDVGPTRRDEIAEGLNISEDEDWSDTLSESEDD